MIAAKRILVLGYFGYSNNKLDGQTIKTRSIYEMLLMKSGGKNNIEILDTQRFRSSKFTFFSMLWKILRCNRLVYLPAQNNLKYLFPIIYVICWLKRSEILYFVVGGWLSEYLKNKPLHIKILSKIRAILTESSELSNSLITEYQFKNVITFPNFRIHSFTPTFVQNSDLFRIVYMARINRMKGIDYVFRLADYFENASFAKRPVIIDFYGQIDKEDEVYFYNQLNMYANISYQGVLQPENIYKTLTNYDLMVLPTRYFTEGFPGTVLDAYISGLPIVATHWKYASDFIIHEKTGLIIPFENSEEDFIRAVVKIYQDDNLLVKMKHNAYRQSINYSLESAWNIFINNNLEEIIT
jgi:glycosyltransferase involved in cell wall biosynthesis